MTHYSSISRGYGAYCFAFGYFILCLAAAGRDVTTYDSASRRYMLGLASAISIVAGTFLMYFHIQSKIAALLANPLADLPQLSDSITKSVPIIDHVLIYAGFIGLIVTIAMREDGTYNLTRGGLALGAFLVIGYTKTKLIDALVQGKDLQKYQAAHLLSWGLLVMAIAYSC
jgi:hypothetical protein